MNNVKLNSQKKFELKEVSQKEKQNICYLGTSAGKVLLRGTGIEGAVDNKRYNGVFDLMSTMENKLDNEIKYDIKLSYIGLEALVKVFIEMQNDKHAIEFFTKNISPRNFFYLVNDLDNQQIYHSSDQIYNKFFSNSTELRALDNFYNEFEDSLDNSFKHNLSNIYVYVRRKDFKGNEKYGYLKEIENALSSKTKKEKVLSFNLFNEYYTDKTKSYLSETSKEELFYKVKRINDNWSKVINKAKANRYYNLDSLYELSIDE